VVDDAAIDTAGATEVDTVIVTVLEFAVIGLTQGAVEVIVQAILSPLPKEAFVYVGLFVPTLLPFNVHW
jgi:hypothetical protein